MAKLASLTADQLKSLNDFDLMLRPAVIEMHKAVRTARAVSQQYAATIVPILSVLDGTEPLPTANGLAGATVLAQPDPGFIVSYLTALVANYDTNLADANHQALYVKAAGSINLVGQ